ncbi:MAG: DNA-directed RNA polymerase subunit beta' [bacterium]|nr:DNA-directed RNA polymerase subunit beta' [bacterium]
MAEFDVNNFESLRIGLASAEKIRSWSYGEVKKPETINYRTLKPEKDGLFCEKIFGPTKDWECNCGKYKRIRFQGIVCERCGVEVTRAKVRRERMGHIELAAPVSHIWYFKGTPSRLGYLLDITPKDLEKVLYFAAAIITYVDEEAREADLELLADDLINDLDAIDNECARAIEDVQSLNIENIDPEEFSDYDEGELLTPEEIAAEIVDIKEEFAERKALRQEAFDTFCKVKVKDLILDEVLFREMKTDYSAYIKGGMGAEAIRELLIAFDLEKTAAELNEIIETGKGQKKLRAIKRLKVVDAFIKSDNNPEDMILTVIPVLPPELRPMVQLDGGRFAASDLNDLYRRVINRNNRLKRLLDLNAPDIIVNNEKRMLQEAVDSLFDNGRRGRPVTGPGNRPLKSLSDMLKGKQGRFRQNLLGKRVDYSGRSVIVVGPQLKMHQCGLPKAMALELFKPFVVERLVELDHYPNVKAAKKAVDRGNNVVWDVLEEVITEHPVLLNRAPTLHRLGIQAFEPVLVEGKAIRLHPLMCTAFNADFDGDQMAVHVPLSVEAQAEARVLMLSTNNIKSPAHGHALTVPTQDMIIGLYYLTAARDGFPGEGRAFIDFKDAINAYDARADVDLQAKIKVRLTEDTDEEISYGKFKQRKAGEILDTTIGRVIFNSVLPDDFPFINFEMNKTEISNLIGDCCERYSLSQMPEILDGLKSLGFHYATLAGVTVSVYDATIPPNKWDILEEAEKKVALIDEHYEIGYSTDRERHERTVAIWNEANEEVGAAMVENFDKFNPIYMMAFSGARGNIKQIRQLAGMRGIMNNPKGEPIDQPIKANFREGLSVLEYFISTHGARKGLADTALRTADSGYMTRRLVDVAQDVIVREHDCGNDDGVEYDILEPSSKDGDIKVDENLVGRCLQTSVVDPETGEILAEKDSYISGVGQLKDFLAHGVKTVSIRTIMTCKSKKGICQKCYGWDLATGVPVNIGTAVGIIAAQSIGEPGTQLTMRTFHTGGVAGEDITQGLPRVNELFEARKPKGQALLAEISGRLTITSDKDNRNFVITGEDGETVEYQVSIRHQLMPDIENDCEVVVGQQLTKGSVNPHDLLRLTDARTTLKYIVSQVQDVYTSQGVDINDKHIEVIARQMLRKISVLDSGDSEYLPGTQVDAIDFEKESERILLEGGTPPTGTPILLGITKASLATDSFLSAASFQETTRVLTDAAIEGKVDYLQGLKENVIIGKSIPAGTGLKKYRNIKLQYRGEPVDESLIKSDSLPSYAPDELQELETLLPKPQDWSLDVEDYIGSTESYSSYLGGIRSMPASKKLDPEIGNLYLFDDLGISQRWANKFSEAGIETVNDLVGQTEEELGRIEGIGAKALEELKEGLKARDLLYILESDTDSNENDVSQLFDMVFSPDESTSFLDNSSMLSYQDLGDDMIGSSMPSIGSIKDSAELDELFRQVGLSGYTIIDDDMDGLNDND